MPGTALFIRLSSQSGVFSRTLLNSLGQVDRVFLWIIVGSVAAAVAFYFLIPLFKKKQYREARENLQKREASFRAATGRTSLEQEGTEQRKETGKNPDDDVQ